MIAVLFAAWLKATNSRAAAARGVAAYQKKDYVAASNAFGEANALKPSPAAAFNLGTAQIANGKREEGSATLEKAMRDRALRADSLYNRGNSALAANAYDYAIRDYVETLKLRPDDANAKRNLEIALQKKQAMQQAGGNNKQKNQQGGQQQQQQKQQTPSAGNRNPQQKPQSDANSEALLRAVQQQEQEELERMKKARATHQRVGW